MEEDKKKNLAYKLGGISAVVCIICLNVLLIAGTVRALMLLF